MFSGSNSHGGDKDMIRTPNATEISHLFALAEHEVAKGRLTEAIILLRFIRSIDPDHSDAAARLALSWFRREQWNEAWDAFDIRFKLMPVQPSVMIRSANGETRELPRWRGGEPPKKLLVMDEQGLGDTVQFIRFLRPLVERGVQIDFVTHDVLFDLIRTMNVPINLLQGSRPGSVGGASGWTPLLHIPRALGLDPASYGDGIPYISADPVRVKNWARKIPSKSFNVGICWAGNPVSPAEKGRSLPLEAFAPLADIPGVRLFSLQKGYGASEINDVSFSRSLHNFGDDLDAGGQAFLDTAAIMMSLDLIVTADTAVAHVAGALGRPVHILLRKDPDWRWLARETDSIWYPTATLYRQRISEDWSEPMALVAADIAARVTPNLDAISRGTLPLISTSYGEIAEKLAALSLRVRTVVSDSKDVQDQYDALLMEWNKVAQIVPLLEGLLKEMEENAKALADAETDLVFFERKEGFGHEILGRLRDIRLFKNKRADLIRRIDVLTRSELTPKKVKTEPSAVRKVNKKGR